MVSDALWVIILFDFSVLSRFCGVRLQIDAGRLRRPGNCKGCPNGVHATGDSVPCAHREIGVGGWSADGCQWVSDNVTGTLCWYVRKISIRILMRFFFIKNI